MVLVGLVNTYIAEAGELRGGAHAPPSAVAVPRRIAVRLSSLKSLWALTHFFSPSSLSWQFRPAYPSWQRQSGAALVPKQVPRSLQSPAVHAYVGERIINGC